MKNLTSVLIFVCVTLALLETTEAEPRFVRLSYTDATETTMTVAWHTDSAAESHVHYGSSSGDLTQTATGTSFLADAPAFKYIHEVTLKDLKPQTTYFYVAGDQADGFSEEHEFTTGLVPDEKCGDFSFGFLGDNRPDPTFGGGQNWQKILNQASAHFPAFFLNGGDLVTDGDNIAGWIMYLTWIGDVSGEFPLMPVIGNHDTGPGEGDTANYNQLFALPRATGDFGSNTEDYYYFTYGNAIFVGLSTESFKTGDQPFADQAAWLDRVLTENPRLWKFVFYHKPSYTHQAFFEISHEPNEDGQNEALIPIIDKHHVDIVFTSHNHWYERFNPTACATAGKPGSSKACPQGKDAFDKGTVFFVSGGAGAFTIPGQLCGIETGRGKCTGDHHYIIVSIENETLELETWAAFPGPNAVIDSISIVKPESECLSVEPTLDAGVDASVVGDSGTDSDAGNGDDAGGDSDADTDSDSDSDSDSDLPGDAAADSDSDTDSDSETDSSTILDSGTEAGKTDSSCGCQAFREESDGLLGLFVGLFQ
jgi:Purple acid Phosphatase, N-terminal domain/Calcineurin-like phosphoesterase